MSCYVPRYIPEDFPVEKFIGDVEGDPCVALIHVDWCYWLFDQLPEDLREVIEPHLFRYRDGEVEPADKHPKVMSEEDFWE